MDTTVIRFDKSHCETVNTQKLRTIFNIWESQDAVFDIGAQLGNISLPVRAALMDFIRYAEIGCETYEAMGLDDMIMLLESADKLGAAGVGNEAARIAAERWSGQIERSILIHRINIPTITCKLLDAFSETANTITVYALAEMLKEHTCLSVFARCSKVTPGAFRNYHFLMNLSKESEIADDYPALRSFVSRAQRFCAAKSGFLNLCFVRERGFSVEMPHCDFPAMYELQSSWEHSGPHKTALAASRSCLNGEVKSIALILDEYGNTLFASPDGQKLLDHSFKTGEDALKLDVLDFTH